jgi:hypothetical protein
MNDTTKVILVSIVLAACIVLLGGLVIMVLWNWLAPVLPDGFVITYWKSALVWFVILLTASAFRVALRR